MPVRASRRRSSLAPRISLPVKPIRNLNDHQVKQTLCTTLGWERWRQVQDGGGEVIGQVRGTRLARRASRYYANLVKLRAGQTVADLTHYRVKIITMKGLARATQ